MRSKVLIVALVFIFICSSNLVSAADFDNVKSFTKNATDSYGAIKITNLFGLGSVLAEYKLINNYDSVINTYAEGIVIIYSEDKLFSDLKFRDISEIEKTIDTKTYITYTENYDVETPVYVEVCREDKENATTVCNNEIESYTTEIKQRESWKLYTGEIVQAGTYRWKIEGKKNINEVVDWVASAYGTEFNEWAWWNSTFNNRKPLNITGGVGTLSNFTVFVNVTYDGNMQTDFDDVRFVNGVCSGVQTEELNYELDYKTNSNSAGFWVLIPSLTTGINEVCMYYGNAGVSSTSSGTNAFDANYTIVMHMSEDSGNYLKNSKNGNTTFMNLTGSPNWIDGVFGKSINLSIVGGNRYARSRASTIVLTNQMTTEQWVYAFGTPVNRVHFNNLDGRGSNNFGLSTGQTGGSSGGCGLFNSAWNSNKIWNDILGAWYAGQCYGTNGDPSNVQVFQNKTDGFGDTGGGSGGAIGGTLGDWAIGYYEGTSQFGNSSYDEIRYSNNLRSSDWLNRSYDNSNFSMFNLGDEQILSALSSNPLVVITLVSPSDNFNTNLNRIIFNATVNASETSATNATLYLWYSNGTLESTSLNNTISGTNTTVTATWNITSLPDQINSLWNVFGCGNNNTITNCSFASANRTFSVGTNPPTVNLTYPKNINIPYHRSGTNLTINWTTAVNSFSIDTCLIEYNGVNRTVACNTNTTQYNITSTTNRTVIFRVNDSVNNFAIDSSIFNFSIFENYNTFNSTSYETAKEGFITNLTIRIGYNITSANLNYNGTSYLGSIDQSGTDYILSRSIDVPSSYYGTNNWFWSLNSSSQNLSSSSQNVSSINLTLCGGSQNISYINFTFKNETVSQQSVSSTFDSSWNYYLGSGTTTNKTYTSTSTTQNASYAYCFTPTSRTLYANAGTITYSNTESPQRSTSQGVYTLTNTSTSVVLFLLPSSLGQSVTFQIVNPALQAIIGATVNISSATTGQLELKTTDASGGSTFFLNPLISYTVIVSATGYSSSTNTITPVSSAYTIQLGANANTSINDYTRGMIPLIKPSTEDQLQNNTVYNFNFTLSSTFWNLDSFGFVLKNQSGTILTSQSSVSPSGGIVSANVNTGINNSRINMYYFWVVNGSYTNYSAFWIVTDNVDTQYSIRTLFGDLTTYLNSGLFGLTPFGLALIIFSSIFIITGVASYKFGITSPSAIMVIIFGLVAFFDVGLNLINISFASVPHFPTAFTFLILIAILFMEGSR